MFNYIRCKIALILLEQGAKEIEKGTLKSMMKSVRYFKVIRFILPKTENFKALIKKGDDTIKKLGL